MHCMISHGKFTVLSPSLSFSCCHSPDRICHLPCSGPRAVLADAARRRDASHNHLRQAFLRTWSVFLLVRLVSHSSSAREQHSAPCLSSSLTGSYFCTRCHTRPCDCTTQAHYLVLVLLSFCAACAAGGNFPCFLFRPGLAVVCSLTTFTQGTRILRSCCIRRLARQRRLYCARAAVSHLGGMHQRQSAIPTPTACVLLHQSSAKVAIARGDCDREPCFP